MTTQVLDDFIGANGTSITDHTPDIDIIGGGWSESGIHSVELDGSGGIVFGGSNQSCFIDTGSTDQIVKASFNAGGSDNRISLFARADGGSASTSTQYFFNFRAGDNACHIYKKVAGANTLLVNEPFTISTSQTYMLEARVIGSNLEFLVDDVVIASTTDASITTGTISGLSHALHTNDSARFYSFETDDGVTPQIDFDVTEQFESITESSLITITPAQNINLSVTESLSAPIDQSFTIVTPNQDINITVTETFPSFIDSSAFNVSGAGSDIINVTETLNSFIDSSLVDIKKDIKINVTEALSSFIDSSNINIPVVIKINTKNRVSARRVTRKVNVRNPRRTVRIR